MAFTHLEKCDMLEVYILCRKNSVRALEQYGQTFPERQQPDRRYFLKLYRKFRSNEKVFEKARTKKEFIISEEVEINVLAYFEAYKNNSTRDLARDSGLCLFTIWRILQKYKFVPYKYRPVQTLLPGDTERRIIFCQWLVDMCRQDPNFVRHILWSDEANFSNRGMFNRKNIHYWSQENLFYSHPRNPQVQYSINVWCGLIGSQIIGPIFYEGTLTGRRYVDLLSEILEEYLDDINLEARNRIYFQQDGAPPHQFYEVRILLERLFQDRWIATNGPIRWPPRSPDITPLDFYFWGYVKNEVYKRRYANLVELEDSIRHIIASIDGRTVLKATTRVVKNVQKCIEQNGDIFAHLI